MSDVFVVQRVADSEGEEPIILGVATTRPGTRRIIARYRAECRAATRVRVRGLPTFRQRYRWADTAEAWQLPDDPTYNDLPASSRFDITRFSLEAL